MFAPQLWYNNWVMKMTFRLLFLCAALGLAMPSFAEPNAALSDAEIWNAGVEAYRANNPTNALKLLRPLMLSKEFGARASEVVAAINYKAAHSPLESTNALSRLEESARAAQITLRANPKDERLNRNFTRATQDLAALRETKHVNDVIAAANGQDPAALLDRAVDDARQILAEAATYQTNVAPRAVALADDLSRRTAALTDMWYPVKNAIHQAVTNEQQAAIIEDQITTAQNHTRAAAEKFADMDEAAYGDIAAAEDDITRFNKMTAGAPQALARDIVAQSNAWLDVEMINARPWQPEALDYTRRFRAAFPAFAKAYEQQAQADTNKPPFTAEAQAEISKLSTELEKKQMECVEKLLPPQQEECNAILARINELMPKDNKGGGSNNQNQNQQQNNQNNQQNNPQQSPENSEGEQPQGNNDQQENQDNQDDENKEGEGEQSPEEQEAEATLKKAQERSDEHEAEKKARMRKAVLPPNERDW